MAFSLPPFPYYGSPSDLSFPPITDGMTSGMPSAQLLAQFNLNGASKLYQNNKFPGPTGLHSANLSESNKFGVLRETYQENDLFVESPLFVSPGEESQEKQYNLAHTAKCLYNVNAYLASEQGCRRFGDHRTPDALLRAFRFVGFLIAGEAKWQSESETETHITVIPGGRARFPEITQAQCSGQEQHRKDGARSNEGDLMWLLLIKCKRDDPVKAALEGSEIAMHKRLGAMEQTGFVAPNSDLPGYFWQYRFVTTTNRTKPELHMYMSHGDGVDPQSEYVGHCEFVGRVAEVYGNRRDSDSYTGIARDCQAGLPGWPLNLSRIPKIAVHVGVH